MGLPWVGPGFWLSPEPLKGVLTRRRETEETTSGHTADQLARSGLKNIAQGLPWENSSTRICPEGAKSKHDPIRRFGIDSRRTRPPLQSSSRSGDPPRVKPRVKPWVKPWAMLFWPLWATDWNVQIATPFGTRDPIVARLSRALCARYDAEETMRQS
jgi:hypothetical protein